MATMFHFKGKEFIYAHHHSTPHRTLDIVHKKSLPAQGQKPSLDDNLIIHGDNLHALKSLLPRYAGRVKCVYIDPPYNTGNEKWCYNDKVNSPLMKRWLEENGAVDKEDLERHDKWCCMMWPRLQLLRELLRDDGVIFISIDDNEAHHLRMMMDEIFGEKNFLGMISVANNLKGRSDDNFIATANDYLIVYAKDSNEYEMGGLPLSDEQIKEYKQEDEWGEYKEIPFRKTGKGWRREDREDMFYPIYFFPEGNRISLKSRKEAIEILPLTKEGKEGRWRWGKDTFEKRKERDIVIRKVRAGEWRIFSKMRLYENGEMRTLLPKSIWLDRNYDSSKGGLALRDILTGDFFDNAKPMRTIRDVLTCVGDRHAIVLDSFAGSGTTAHAVLALNKADGGDRQFILVECEDYADSVTAERVRRVIQGVPHAKNEALRAGLGGSFTYCALGRDINTEELLAGKNMPTYDEFAKYVFYTATGKTIDTVPTNPRDWFVGETESYRIHLIYRQDSAFLRGKESALTSDLAHSIDTHRHGKTALVYAPWSFMPQKDLVPMGIRFCQLPWSIHRVAG
ncbi:MAG: site-specific DNA-methyltransferase [Alphaproteobacteria bacterium GM7ARS4]|nr:site-specific DNA-methyltransferase [Alphaproteobacteria bacterium GM7ARS4]